MRAAFLTLMHRFTLDATVDEMVATLAQRRQVSRQRDQAYIALAQAILMDEPCEIEKFETDAA